MTANELIVDRLGFFDRFNILLAVRGSAAERGVL